MKYSTTTILLATTAAVANAQAGPRGNYLYGVCQPLNSSSLPDLNAPCNAIAAIQAQCIYGPAWLESMYDPESLKKRQNSNGDDNEGVPQNPADSQTQSNEAQRVCLCQSQFWSLTEGCYNCYQAHGGEAADDGSPDLSADLVASISSAYCAVSATPTAGLADMLFSYADSFASSATSTATQPTSFSDRIGNKTEVSYYYTGSVTGSAAWVVAQPTGASGVVSFTTTSTRDGQIVATTSSNNANAPTGTQTESGSGANPTESGSAASRREVVAAAGLCGFFGIVAFVL